MDICVVSTAHESELWGCPGHMYMVENLSGFISSNLARRMSLDSSALIFFFFFFRRVWVKLFAGNIQYFVDQIFPVVWPADFSAQSAQFPL